MKKRIQLFRTDLPLSYEERQEMVEQIKTRLVEMGYDDDVMILVHMSYEGAIEDWQ